MAQGWRVVLAIVTVLTFVHILTACARGGRLRHFLWPVGIPFWLVRGLRPGGLYAEARDGFWDFVAALRLPYYFRLGLVGFLGTLVWLVVPASLIAASGRYPVLGFLGAFLLAFVAPSLPFLQVRYAVEGQVGALFSLRSIRERFRRAPWAFAFALMVLLRGRRSALPPEDRDDSPRGRLAAQPRLRHLPRPRPSPGRLGLCPVVAALSPPPLARPRRSAASPSSPSPLFYVLVVVLAQYTSWGGIWSLYEQHAFLLPVPFLNM